MAVIHPNMNYEEAYSAFSWDHIHSFFSWPKPYLNAAYEACTKHAKDEDKLALIIESETGGTTYLSFSELDRLSNKFANMLNSLGIKLGDRIAIMLPRSAETHIAYLGIWKAGAVLVPIFTAFGPEAIKYRLQDSNAKMIVISSDQLQKLQKIQHELNLERVILVQRPDVELTGTISNCIEFWDGISEQSSSYDIVRTTEDQLCTIAYTSGTTGPPKGVMINHGGIKWLIPLNLFCHDLRPDDLFFTTADHGWTYGLFTAGISIWLEGLPRIIYDGKASVEAWYRLMEKLKVTKIGSAPTAYRMMREKQDLLESYRIKLRAIFSAGEPLEPEIQAWLESTFECPVINYYGLSELGMVVNNYLGLNMKIKRGSIGKPMPGFEVVVMDGSGNALPAHQIGTIGVKLNPGTLGSSYWNKPEEWEKKLVKGYFDTGDMAYQDDEGYFWFVGRSDDIIKTAGYRVGPVEIESTLLGHPAISEAAVVGKPDPVRGTIIKAFVVLRPGFIPSEQLAKEIIEYVKQRYSAHAYPRELEFVSELPKTETGKIKRAELRALSLKD